QAQALRLQGGSRPAAEALLARGRPDAAGRLLLAEPGLGRADADLLWRGAAALMQARSFRLAKELFARIFELDPKAWNAGWNAHFCRLELSEIDGALDWLRRL